MKKTCKWLLKKGTAVLLCCALLFSVSLSICAERLADRYENLFTGETATYDILPTYGQKRQEWQNDNAVPAAQDVEVPISSYQFAGKEPQFVQVEGKTGLLLDENTQEITFSVIVPTDGLYEMEMQYYPYEGGRQAIRRAIGIDGNIPFREAENACIYRRYVFAHEVRFNHFGDQLTYGQEEKKGWYTAQWQDVDGRYSTPWQWWLTAGEHRLTFTYVDQPLLLHAITLKAPKAVRPYKAVSAEYPPIIPQTKPLVIQAEAPENIAYRTDSTVNGYTDRDPATRPAVKDTGLINAVGGSNWSGGNQKIVYTFSVPSDGLYTLALRVQQPWTGGMNAYRQIAIDGIVPFAEMNAYAFPFCREWYTQWLTDANGEPYRFYLTKGNHTVSMKAVMAEELSQAVEQVQAASDILSTLYRKILLITGAQPDPNYDYDLEKSIPDLKETFANLRNLLKETEKLIMGCAKKQPSAVSNLAMVSKQIEEMEKDPDRIPGRLGDISNSMTTLGNSISQLQFTPLGMDELVWLPEGTAADVRQSTFWQRLAVSARNFILSFRRDYSSISQSQVQTDKTIDVWVSRGTEWAMVMRRLIQEDFETTAHIGVNLNVLPSGTLASTVNPLLLAITSGNGPDVVLNVDANTAVEYGVRGTAIDLLTMPDYDQVVKRFHPEITKAVTFRQATYALPETMSFYLMAYRKDILKELSLRVPKTWQEVYYQVLPVLYQSSMTMQAANFDTYLYQYGGSYYTDDGLQTALDSAQAHKAFAATASQFLNLGYPINANFFSRFRTGEMPIGFVDYASYMQILTAAPELAGKWGVVPVPGTMGEDGTLHQETTGLTGTVDIILRDAEDSGACWEFLKWWSSAETQTAYGLELESLLGTAARLNTANLEAFRSLPWGKETMAAIEKYWEQAQVVPNVLGGIITTRAVNNATNLALYDGYTPREALEIAVKDIREELIRKQNLYGIST